MAEQEQSKWQFEEEIKALGAEEVQAEFSGYFASIVRATTLHLKQSRLSESLSLTQQLNP